eukprot:1139227-Pelagomonas_calceolata.AAC.6
MQRRLDLARQQRTAEVEKILQYDPHKENGQGAFLVKFQGVILTYAQWSLPCAACVLTQSTKHMPCIVHARSSFGSPLLGWLFCNVSARAQPALWCQHTFEQPGLKCKYKCAAWPWSRQGTLLPECAAWRWSRQCIFLPLSA